MPSQWDHKADKDLLLTIIEDGNLTHIDWQSVAIKLRAKEYTFSHEACRQHYQKIRKESRNGTANSGANSSFNTPTKATPSAKATPGSRTKHKKSINASTSNSNEEDEEDMAATPSAKRKRSVKHEKVKMLDMGGFAGQTAAQFKVENLGGGDGKPFHIPFDLADEGLYNA